MIDHDRLFKELISTFFLEFLELFFPQVMAYLEPESLKFLDKEVFTDVTAGEQYEADLVVQIRFRGGNTFAVVAFVLNISDPGFVISYSSTAIC